MIFRRIKAHIEKENWFAVFIDFCIVVIGVFIGIQVANWNEARADGQQEQEILANIMDDLRSDVTELGDGIRMAEINIQAGNYALRGAGLIPVEVLELATENASINERIIVAEIEAGLRPTRTERLWSDLVVRYHPTQSDTSFDTLLATGRLGLIKDRELVRQLQAYRQNWADIEISQNATFRPFRDQTVFVGQKSGLSPFSQLPEENYFALIEADRELAGAIRTMLEYSILHRDQLIITQDLAEGLLVRMGGDDASRN